MVHLGVIDLGSNWRSFRVLICLIVIGKFINKSVRVTPSLMCQMHKLSG